MNKTQSTFARTNSVPRFAAGAALLCASLLAQDLSVTVSPNPAPLGATITVTAQDASGLGLYTPFGCLISSIRSGTPGGPTVRVFPCTFLGVAIPPCPGAAVRTGTWNQSVTGGTAAPGLYWIEIQKSVGPFGAITTEWHSVTIDTAVPSVPVLSAVNTPTWGNVFQMAVNAPSHPSETYVVAMSLTTNTGLLVSPGVFLSLDLDALFFLSFPTPDPILFANFQGVLDSNGAATGIGINFPNVPLGCIPLHAQVATVDSFANVALSNDLHFTVR